MNCNFLRKSNSAIPLLLGLFLALPWFVNAQTVSATKCVNPNFWANGTPLAGATVPTPVSFVAGVDFPVGYMITDVRVSVTWSRTQTNCAGAAGTDDVSEVGFGIVSPSGTSRYFAASNNLAALVGAPGPTWSGTGTVSGVTTVFQDAGTSPSGLPVSGTFRRNGHSLSSLLPAGASADYLGDSPFGNWNLLVVDDNNNTSGICIQSYCVTIVACPGTLTANCRANVTLPLSAVGSVSPTFAALDNASDTSCLLSSVVFAPAGPFACANIGAPFNVTMTLTDHLGQTSACVSSVTIADTTRPVVTECNNAPASLDDTIYLDLTGNANYAGSNAATSTDNCAVANEEIDVDPGPGITFGPVRAFTCANAGANIVRIRVTDASGNTTVCDLRVVVFDTVDPIAVCQNTTAYLDGSGNATVAPSAINNGSSSACAPAALTFQINGLATQSYTCANLGANTATLSVIENNTPAQGGVNTATCNATVTVLDTTRPVANCGNLTIVLDASGNATVNASTVAATSTDNCSPLSYTFSSGTTVSYTCANIGNNAVFVTVTDPSGNSDSCSATLVVSDTTDPNAICQNRTVFLNAAGNGSVTAAQVNNGSTDACGIASVQVNGAASANYTCANVGANTATLTVTDVNGNVGTCSATITVQDTVRPVANCQNITVQLNGVTGNVNVVSTQINNGSTDACGGLTFLINGAASQTYTCANVGANTATLTVTDVNGNFSTCSSTITVQDTVRPTAICQNLTVQLSAAGTATVAATAINNGSTDICGGLTFLINGAASANYTCANVGNNTATLTVTDVNGNFSTCSSTITVQDTVSPNAICQNFTAQLNGVTGNVTVTPANINNGSSDACGIASLTINSAASVTYTCANIGTNATTLTVTDVNGNTRTCNATVTVQDNVAPNAVCQNITVYLSGVTGNVTVTPAQINNSSSDICGIASLTINALASETYSCADIGPNNATLTVTDVNGNPSACVATVTVLDTVRPTAICQNITVQLSAVGGTATVTPAQINNGSSDACTIVTQTINGLASQNYTCANVGNNNATLQLTDANGNTNSCVAVVTVQDTVDPVANCQNITVQLSAAGTATVAATQIDNASTDNCGIASRLINGAASVNYTCANVGPNAATLTLTDVNGNVSTCNATVTIADTVRPTAICQNITVHLSGVTGNVSVTGTQINNGSSDACGLSPLLINGLASQTYTCANVGANTATLTVTDVNGNNRTCTSTVTVLDTVRPVATCQNITVQLSAVGGTVNVTPAQINNGSSDICGGLTFQINNAASVTYTCANVGNNTATLRVTDANGNFSTCTSTVTVQDTVDPVANCQNITVQLSAAGTATVTPSQIDNTSTDNCGIANRLINGNVSQAYTCANVGPNTATLTLTDVNGNVSTCNATVTIADTVRPTALCQNRTVYLNGVSGNVSVTGAQIDNGSSDACGLSPLLINGLASQTYTCANVGANTATLTVTDVNGNNRTCTSTVTVLDTVRPVAACQNITVQLSAVGGTANVTPANINNGSSDICGGLTFLINGAASVTYTCANVGNNNATLQVTDVNGNISTCVSVVTVQDTVRPTANCQNITVQLSAAGSVTVTPTQIDNASTDNCGIATRLINGNVSQAYTCANVGANTATLTLTDVNGNVRTCNATVTVADTVRPTAICQNITVQLSTAGTVSVTGTQINNGSSDACGLAPFLINGLASQAYTCANIGANTATLTVTDVNGNNRTCTSTVTVLDTVRPNAICQNITVFLNGTGAVSVLPTQINNNSTDACGISSLLINGLASQPYSCAHTSAAQNAILTVTDVNGNIATCVAVVTVRDTVRPNAICQNRSVFLNSTGNASVTAAQINNLSSDACGIASIAVNGGASAAFTCANVGVNTVTLTVTDVNGNTNTCTAQVTVQDTIRPTAICQNRTVQLDPTGNVSVNVTSINNGSTDNCGVASVLFNTGLAAVNYTCANVGTNNVRIIVTDVNGNRDSCNAVVTVQDVTAPTAVCQNANIYLTGAGTATIPGSAINGGSTDACGIASLSTSPSTVNCSNIAAPVNVTLTVTDVNGLTATCLAQVTVLDTVRPTAICANPTVYLNPLGVVSVVTSQINNGSTDACGIAQTFINGSSNQLYTCANVGPNTAVLTVIDNNGNSSTCNATVTVQDTVRPTARCRAPFNVYLSGTGTFNLTPVMVDSSSSDNCAVNTAAYTVNSLASINYTCANTTASQTVILRVVDVAGNFSTCSTTVFVRDTTRPVAQCVASITRNLSSTNPGTVTVNAISLNNGSSDACAPPLTYLINGQPSVQYTCANLGNNTATLSVVDPSGNIGTCTSTIIINDITPPLASCVPNVILNLDSTGQGNVIGSSLNAGSTDNCAVTTFLINGAASQLYTCANIGNNLAVLTVRDASGNQATCTSVVTVQDLRAPTARCFSNPVDVYLNASGTVAVTGTQIDSLSTDNCSIATRLINNAPSVTFTCSNIGLNNVTLTVRDPSNNSNSCPARVFVRDTIMPAANCQNITVNVNAVTGLAIVNATAINNNSTDNCSITSLLINGQTRDTFNCTNIGANIATLTVTDNSGNVSSCQSTITIADVTAPVVTCTNSTFYLDAAGQVFIAPTNVAVGVDACGVVNYTIDNLPSKTYTCTEAGQTLIDTIRAFDASGNMGSCVVQITVRDTISPVASCNNIIVQLDSFGVVTVSALDINGTSFDNCSIATYLINNQASINFNCSNVGVNTVTLRVIDPSGNASTCTATVTVEDDIAPIANCQNIAVQLDNSGNVTVPAVNINGIPSSTDACGPIVFTINGQPSISFNCTNVGANAVTLEVTDANGNVSTCNSTITVQDLTPPAIVCQNYTLFLDQSGNGTVFPANITDSASTDNCNFIFWSLNNAASAAYNCSNVGTNNVMLIGTDQSGNQDTCMAVVTVTDTVRPVVNCNNILINLTATGADTLTTIELGVFASDACGIDTTVIAPGIIDCSNIGLVPVQVISTDVNGNSSVCISQVTVVLDGPQPSATDSLLCEGENFQLFANPPATGFTYDYSWTGPNGFTSNIANPLVTNVQAASEGYYVVVITPQGVLSSCAIADSVFIDINYVPAPVLAVNAPICDGDSAVLTLANDTAYVGTNFTYQWFHTGAPVGPNNDTFIINPVTAADGGDYTMIITVDGCTDSSAAPLNVVINALPTAFTPSFIPTCEGDTLLLFANPPATGPFTYTWDGPASFNATVQDPSITPIGFANEGTYNVTITDVNTCTATGSVAVTITPTPSSPALEFNNPLCLDDVLILTDTVSHIGTVLTFIWTDPNGNTDTTNIAQYTLPSASEGTYAVQVIADGCPSPVDTQSVVYEPAPDALNDAFSMPFRDSVTGMDLTLNDAVRAGYSISIIQNVHGGTLTQNANGTFNYTPGNIFNGLDTFTYQVCDPVCPTVCDTAMVVLDVILDQRCFMPTGISPNGDGINDVLVIVCRDQFPNMKIKLYSRWGNRVYEGHPSGWDARFDGKDLPDGAYFFILDYGDGTEPETGYITVHR